MRMTVKLYPNGYTVPSGSGRGAQQHAYAEKDWPSGEGAKRGIGNIWVWIDDSKHDLPAALRVTISYPKTKPDSND